MFDTEKFGALENPMKETKQSYEMSLHFLQYIKYHRMASIHYLRSVMDDFKGINEEKLDNRIANLYLCTAQEHTAIHSEGRRLTWKHKDKLRETASRTAERRRGRKVVMRDLSGKSSSGPRSRSGGRV